MTFWGCFLVFFFVLIDAPLAAVDDDDDDEEEVVVVAAVVFEATDAGGFGAATPMGPAEERTARKSRVAFLGAAPASAGVELIARAVCPPERPSLCCVLLVWWSRTRNVALERRDKP